MYMNLLFTNKVVQYTEKKKKKNIFKNVLYSFGLTRTFIHHEDSKKYISIPVSLSNSHYCFFPFFIFRFKFCLFFPFKVIVDGIFCRYFCFRYCKYNFSGFYACVRCILLAVF